MLASNAALIFMLLISAKPYMLTRQSEMKKIAPANYI